MSSVSAFPVRVYLQPIVTSFRPWGGAFYRSGYAFRQPDTVFGPPRRRPGAYASLIHFHATHSVAFSPQNARPKCPAHFDGTAHPAFDQDIHAYKCPGGGDIRGVCPALNTLANHSYLPHNGKDITIPTLIHALHTGYGISLGFANFLVLGSYYLLKRDPLKPLDLLEIAKHNGIEHNASVVHDDADGAPLAPPQVDQVSLHKFLHKVYSPASLNASEGEDAITVEDIAHTRVEREAVSGPIDATHAEIARGEFAMVLNIFGRDGPSGKTLDKEEINMWLNENRLPDGWAPGHTERLWDTIAESKKMRELMKAYRDTGKEVVHHGLWSTLEKTVEELLHKVETVAHLHGPVVKAVEVVSDEKLPAVGVTTEEEALTVKAQA